MVQLQGRYREEPPYHYLQAEDLPSVIPITPNISPNYPLITQSTLSVGGLKYNNWMFRLEGTCCIKLFLLFLTMVMVTRQASFYPLRAPYWGAYQINVVNNLGGNFTGITNYQYFSVTLNPLPSNLAEMSVVLASYQLAYYPAMQFRITQPTLSSQNIVFGVQVVGPSIFAFLRFFVVYNTNIGTPYFQINVKNTTCNTANGAVGTLKSETFTSAMRLTGVAGTTFTAYSVLSSIMLTNSNQATQFSITAANPTSGGPLTITLSTTSSIAEIIITTFILSSAKPVEYVFFTNSYSLNRTTSITTSCNTLFGIPSMNGPTYNQNCSFGITGVQDDNPLVWRSTYFDVTATNFTSCGNNVEGTTIGKMEITWLILCSYQAVCSSPNEYYDPLNQTSCKTCTILNSLCKTCNVTTCYTCDINYYPLLTATVNTCPPCNQTYCTLCLSVNTCGACNNSAYLSNQTCLSCTRIPHCVYCSDNQTCVTCVDTYGSFFGTCGLCSVMIPQCYLCQSHFNCVKCNLGYYVSPGNASCTACDSKCANCTSNTNCTACLTGYFLQDPVNCISCSQSVPNCTACFASTNCTACALGSYLMSNTSCLPCNMAGCVNCTASNRCAVCSLGYYLNPTSYQCGKCKDQNCLNCSTSTNCLVCLADYKLETDNTSWWNCTCQYGWTVTGVCINVTACVTAVKVSGAPTCLFCNSLNYFILSNGACACQTGYRQIADNCSIVCGDGIVISGSEGCDDGNNNDGDGCSSTCVTENGYNCSSISGNYRCQYKGKLSVSLAYILKSQLTNSATYYFNIQPTPYNLQINASFNASITITGRSQYLPISYTYSDGMIMVQLSFMQDIEGAPATLSMSFDQSYFNTSSFAYPFTSVGTNQPLIISSYTSHIFYLKIMAYAIVCLGGLLLLLSAGLQKMVGIETVNVLQIVVFSKLVQVQNDILVSGGIINLKYINGYNDIGKNLAHTNELPLTFRRLQFNSDFILNFQTGVFLMGLSLIMLFILEIYKWRTMTQLHRKKKGSTDQLKLAELRLDEKRRFLYERVFLMVACVTLFDCIAAVRMQSRSIIGESHYTYFALNLVGMLLSLAYIFAILAYQTLNVGKEHNWIAFFCSYSEHYVGYYLCYIIILTPFLVSGETFSGYIGAFVVSGIIAVHLKIMTFWRPYKQPFHNFAIIFNNVVLIFVLIVSILLVEMSIPEKTQLIWAYVIMGLLFLVEILAFIRLYLASKKPPKEGQRVKGEDDKLTKGMEKVEQEYLNPDKRNQKALLKSAHDEEELAKIRNRLKKQFKAKIAEQPMEL